MTSVNVYKTIDKVIKKSGITFLLVCYQIIDHAIMLFLSNSISVRNIISNISMASPCIRRNKER